MIHSKFYKYALLTNLVLCGGLFLPVVGLMDNSHYRYLPYDIIQAPGFFIANIVDTKFHNSEELATWNSFGYVGPLLNLVSASAWTFMVMLLIRLFRRTKDATASNPLWKTAYKLNAIIATAMFLLWLPMTDFFIRGISKNPLSDLQFFLLLPLEFLGFVTELVGSVFLDTGGDTAFGFSDTELLAKLVSGFGVTAFCILAVWIRRFLLERRKPAANSALAKAGLTE